MAEQSIKDKTIKGTFWSAADAFLGQGVTFFVGLVLARILSPSEYGLIGIVTIFTSILTGIVDSGFSNALIRKKNTIQEDYDTMFITNIVFSVTLYIILYLCSPLISSFFNRQELTALTRVTGTILIIQALSLVQNTVLTKRVDFKTKTKASVISALISGTIGIVLALNGFGVWALVWQILSKQLFYTICLWILNRWKPSFNFSKESFHYMWGFGWKLMLSGLLNNIWNQLYQVVVGKCYSPSTLGHYTRAKEYAQIFSSNFTLIFQRVTYPILASVQDEKERMVFAYRKIIKVSMFISFICLFLMGAVSGPLLYCLIGPQWGEAATYLPFICVTMSLYPLHAINLNMLQVLGRSDIYLQIELLKKFIAIVPLCLGIFIGIYWMLIGSIIVSVIAFFINSFYSGKELKYTSWMQLKDISKSLMVSIMISLPVYFLNYLPLSDYIILPLQLLLGLIICFVVCEQIQLEEYIEIKNIVLSYYKKITKK